MSLLRPMWKQGSAGEKKNKNQANSILALKARCFHQDLHTQSHPSTASQGGLGHTLRVAVLHGIVPSSLPFIYSVKHDTCINSGRILELCVPHTICFPVEAPLLSKKNPTTASICRLPEHHKGAGLLFWAVEVWRATPGLAPHRRYSI